jgi:hypothetical protein
MRNKSWLEILTGLGGHPSLKVITSIEENIQFMTFLLKATHEISSPRLIQTVFRCGQNRSIYLEEYAHWND